MKSKLRLAALALTLALTTSAWASVTAYVGDGAEKVYIETTSGKEAFVLIEGVGPWSTKVFKTQKEIKSGGEAFSLTFEYFLELSTGKMKKFYTPVVSDGKTLFEGSLVNKIRLYFPGAHRDGLSLRYDLALSQASQKMDLAGKFKKTPFVPSID